MLEYFLIGKKVFKVAISALVVWFFIALGQSYVMQQTHFAIGSSFTELRSAVLNHEKRGYNLQKLEGMGADNFIIKNVKQVDENAWLFTVQGSWLTFDKTKQVLVGIDDKDKTDCMFHDYDKNLDRNIKMMTN